MSIDSVLMIGFGGPSGKGCCQRRDGCPFGDEATCFTAGILGDNPARQGRIEAVAEHYRALGGVSPYNRLTEEQANALAAELRRRGSALPVHMCFRHWFPWAPQVLRQMHGEGLRESLLLIMAPQQSSVSWDWYIKHVGEAMEAVGDTGARVVQVAECIHGHPGYAEACAARLSEAQPSGSAVIFTAHAIPEPVETTSPYRQQVCDTAKAIARHSGLDDYRVAFQSQPDDSRIPWSRPSVIEAIDEAAEAGASSVCLHPIGFLVENVEILHDLDQEARDHAEARGLSYKRVDCVQSHPRFIAALADLVGSQLLGGRDL